MILSRTHRYVYIGIPRTGSKSMSRWLVEHYQGEMFGDHHEWRVPEFAQEYLIFTTVRNPYQRVVSGYFSLTWDDLKPRAELREQLPLPDKAANPLTRILQEEIARRPSTPEPDFDMNQKPFTDKAGVKLVLYFERLPSALTELPFVDKAHVPLFPHALERGIRPPGDFFDFFSAEDEAAFWDYSLPDFTTFGYQRFSSGLSAEAPNALYIE